MLTGSQVRAARAILRWTGHELAAASGVSYGAIQRAETVDGMPNMQTKNLAAIKSTLEAAGLQFIDGPYSDDGGPSVRLAKAAGGGIDSGAAEGKGIPGK